MTDQSGKESRIVRSDGRLTDESARRIREELKLLAAMPDDDIDYSDIPETTPEQRARAIPNPYYRPVKDEVTLDLDRFVLHWFMLSHDDYRTAISEALSEHVTRERAARAGD